MSEQEEMIAAAERYLSRQPVHKRDGEERPLYYPNQMLRAFCAGHVAVIESDTPPPVPHVVGWTKVPEEPPLELLRSINADNQVLAYENGRYYNAWFEFEPSEGGWLWTDDADSEPNPSHYCALPDEPRALSTATPRHSNDEE